MNNKNLKNNQNYNNFQNIINMTLYDFFLNIYLSKGNNKKEVKSNIKFNLIKFYFLMIFLKIYFLKKKKIILN